MKQSIAVVDNLVCDECNTRIAIGEGYIELPAVYTIDTLWLHTVCWQELERGIDAWLCQEEAAYQEQRMQQTPPTTPACDDLPF